MGIIEAHQMGEVSPDVRELADLCGVYINAVAGHLKALKKYGLIAWEERRARTLRPTCRFIPASDLDRTNAVG
jgi:hypothetical protein